MKDPKLIKGTQVVFGPCRLSYTYVFAKFIPDNGTEEDGKYMTNILIPKSEKKTIAAINRAIEEAKKRGLKPWHNKIPKNLKLPLRDGDERDKDVETYAYHYYLNAKCATRPGIVDRDYNPIVDEEEMYSGVWACASVTFFPYNSNGNCGIGCGNQQPHEVQGRRQARRAHLRHQRLRRLRR